MVETNTPTAIPAAATKIHGKVPGTSSMSTHPVTNPIARIQRITVQAMSRLWMPMFESSLLDRMARPALRTHGQRGSGTNDTDAGQYLWVVDQRQMTRCLSDDDALGIRFGRLTIGGQ